MNKVINIVIAGLGGQGVIKASDIVADAAFRAGHDVKKAEVHGMSQRGGSVTTDVRFGAHVLSPMVSRGCADFLVVLEETQIEANRPYLGPHGVLLPISAVDLARLPSPKTANTAMIGLLSTYLDIAAPVWQAALRAAFPAKLLAMNEQAFAYGRECGSKVAT